MDSIKGEASENKIGTYYMPYNTDKILTEMISKIQSLNKDCSYTKTIELLKTYIDKEYNFTKHQDLVDHFYKQINYPEKY